MIAIPQKSPCACSLERRPSLTQLSKLCLGLSQGSALQAETLAMRSKAQPFLRQFLRWGLAHGIEHLGLCWGAREQFPSALALQRALREALLTCRPQQAATGITEATFELVVGPRQARLVLIAQQDISKARGTGGIAHR